MATAARIRYNQQIQWNYEIDGALGNIRRAEERQKARYAAMTPEERARENENSRLLHEAIKEQDKRIAKACKPYCRPLCLSKCEMNFGLIGAGMLLVGAVLSVVSDTASIALGYPGAGLLVGMFVKRVFIATYFYVRGCPDDSGLNLENGWKEWCLFGRTSATFCNN